MRFVIAVLVTLLGCERTQNPRLVTDAELVALEAAVMKRVEETQRRACPRPVLRGTPLPGPAAADQRPIVEGTGELAACAAKIAELGKGGADLKAKGAARDPAMLAIATECGPRYEAAIQRAVAHEDACSAYQAGVRASPAFMPWLRVAHVLALHARERAATDRDAALWLLIDASRFADDLSRGHATLLDLMISSAAQQIFADAAFAILATPPPPAAAGALADALGVMLASQQPFADTLRGERDLGDLHYGLGPLKPRGWEPPGGWGADMKQPELAKPGDEPGHPRDAPGLMMLTSERARRELGTACSQSASLEACAAHLATQPAKIDDPDARLVKLRRDLAAAEGSEAARLRVRDEMVSILDSVARPAFADYVKKRARVSSKLVALRIHLELARRGTCAIDLPDAVVAPPWLGGRMQLARTDTQITIAPPAWTAGNKTEAALPAYPCPTK